LNIIAATYNYFPHKYSGGETYMHRLLKGLQSFGHNCKVAAHTEACIYDGIEIMSMGGMENLFKENNEAFQWADVIFFQLIGNAYGYNKARQHKKPSIFFAHNTSKHYYVENSHVVYNSNFLANKHLFKCLSSTVLQPLVYPEQPVISGFKICLINCNYNKGGGILVELAELMPDEQFLGIRGMYGEQIIGNRSNLEYRDSSPNMDWSDIKLIICPSEFESWCQVATEAIVRGIPVICSDIEPLRENLSYAGIYAERKAQAYADTIHNLDFEKQRQLCFKRSAEYNAAGRLNDFNTWLCNTINK